MAAGNRPERPRGDIPGTFGVFAGADGGLCVNKGYVGGAFVHLEFSPAEVAAIDVVINSMKEKHKS